MTLKRTILAFATLAIFFTGQSAYAASELPPDPENTLFLDLDYGRVVIRMRPDLAPKHVARLKQLARGGYYDGIVFHRVIDKMMAQAGDPLGLGTGGSGRNLKAEFTRTPQIRGTVSMARMAGKDSADSQFFIVLDDVRNSLEGQYTVWGQVVSGMEFVDMIHKGDKTLGKVANPDRIVKMQVAADAERPLASDDVLKRADIAAAAADFGAGDVRCVALAARPGSETQAALGRLWAHGYVAGYARVNTRLTWGAAEESGITESCAARPEVFLRPAAQHTAETPRELPSTNGIFDATAYACRDFTAARKGSNKAEAALVGLWSFSFIEGYKSLAQPKLQIPVEARTQLVDALARACEKLPDTSVVDMTAAVAAKVKLK
jgi:peptidylprolyl isomerase